MYQITHRIVALLALVTIGLATVGPSHPTFAAEPQRPARDAGARPLSAARSFSIKVVNTTGRVWQRTNWSLSHGTWSQLPPETLNKVTLDDDGNAVNGVITFGSQSDGLATGTAGTVDYQSTAGPLHIRWNNPFLGANDFDVVVPAGYKREWTPISGNNANVTVTISRI